MKYRNISHTINVIFRKIHFIFGYHNYVNAVWWGVEIKGDIRFDGRCYFQRYPKSRITINSKCQFRSRINSNLIGINRPCSISTLSEIAVIEIGTNCGFSGTVIGAVKYIKIGNNVRCGANTLITDSDWHWDDYRSGEPSNVIIEDNVWLGVNSVVLKGVTIGENTVIGANSVVTKSIPPNAVAAGNPCKVIKYLYEN
ncbi:MAG: acyltransferase [Paludibacter sp.]